MCSTSADARGDGDPPLGWTTETIAGSRRWVCDACTRHFVRSIEAKLDHDWW